MSRFDYFVVFAEMRTGSNFLEANINSFEGLSCHGEAFNPHFIGYPNRDKLLGLSQVEREKDPRVLIDLIREAPGLNGFRFFNDHDSRVLDICLPDPRCAKIILTRNPVESFVSWKIAAATGQWKLTNVKHAKSAKVPFDGEEFEDHLSALQDFQVVLLNGLQRTGQTAFYIAYEDLQDLEVMNGLAAYLGCDDRISRLDKSLKKQNPAPLSQKVEDFEAMAHSLARLDRFNLTRTPNFEPRRGAMIPSYVAAPKAPLLFAPIRSGPTESVKRWLAALDKQPPEALQSGFTQKTMRSWQRAHPDHRSFTVLRHPLARAHAAFCRCIVGQTDESYPEVRRNLHRHYGLEVPEDGVALPGDGSYDHRSGFLTFLSFLRSNLSAQTSLRIDPAWASQLALLQGISSFGPLDALIREDEMATGLVALAERVGCSVAGGPGPEPDPLLAQIYDEDLEHAARDAYLRDYEFFGFRGWAA